MTFDVERLYGLLPAIYRIRDVEEGLPLRALLEVIAEQAAGLEENLSQLYDDQFAETAAPWVVPYIADLLGITGLPGGTISALTPRAEVAHTIGYRRRKGTIAMLEQLAHDVTGWPARGVEFFELLAATQYMNHLRPQDQGFIDVRDADRLELLGGPFERAAAGGTTDLTHTVDVRRVARGRGRYNIPNIGLFLWRLQSISLTRSPAVPAAPGDRRRFRFSPLGADGALFNLPETESEVTHLAEPVNVPDRIGRRVLARSLSDYYGHGQSLVIELADADPRVEPTAIPSDQIVVCDLTGWTNLPATKIAIDPVLGRVAFPQDQSQQVLVTFHYGFSARMGGGEYSRFGSAEPGTRVLDPNGDPIVKKVVNGYFSDTSPGETFTTIKDALDHLGPKGGVVEILNSGRYEETLAIDATGRHITVRAADQRRPTVVLGADLTITGGPNDDVTLDGLLIAGGAIRVAGQLGRLRIAQCTLVPGITLGSDGAPVQPGAPTLVIASENTQVTIDHAIVGAIRAGLSAEVTIADSIVDATAESLLAFGGPVDFGAPLTITNSTVIGRVRTSIMRLASNTIFMARFASPGDKASLVAPVLAERRQEGCVRFSYLSPGARVPPRFHCQPESDAALVRSQLVSTRYHDAAYCQLRPTSPPEIWQGADDEAEMGAFHDLFEPQRVAHLTVRVQEYLRFGLEAGVFYAT